MTLIHQLASPFARCNGAGFALIDDAGIVERGQEARVRTRTIAVRIRLCGCGDRDYGGAARRCPAAPVLPSPRSAPMATSHSLSNPIDRLLRFDEPMRSLTDRPGSCVAALPVEH
jgi:hypothetical protein